MSEGGLHAFHGGASFEAIGVDFRTLDKHADVVDADVLDAWYDPAPGVLKALTRNLPWLVKTSPPTHGEGLVKAISEARGVPAECVLLGGGTSSLMYEAFPHLVQAGGKVTVLDPMYGEYTHIFGQVLPVQMRCSELDPERGFRPDLDKLAADCADADLVVLVNPNSPTGVCVDERFIEALLGRLRPDARVWIDETYIDFAPGVPSVERLAATDRRLIVAKSMSKHYSLSGMRVGYLCGHPEVVRELQAFAPPWSVGLMAQVAAVEALRDTDYYYWRVEQTHELRDALAAAISGVPGVQRVFESVTNFLMFELNSGLGPDVVRRMAEKGVYLRCCDSLSPRSAGKWLRTAVKDAAGNKRIVEALRASLV